jgi:RNA polymerase sigma-70 factor (sigma-E family)
VADEAELAAFCRDEWPRLVGALSLYTGDPEVAEEIGQEALVRAVEHWDEVATMASPSAWVHRVAFNQANSVFRRRRVFRRLRPRFAAHEVGGVALDAAEAIAVRRAVASLPERQRRVLVLRYFADLSVNEVAESLGCPANTVKTLTRRAIAALRGMGLGESDDALGEEQSAGGAP